MSDLHDLTLSIIDLLSDRRSDAIIIVIEIVHKLHEKKKRKKNNEHI